MTDQSNIPAAPPEDGEPLPERRGTLIERAVGGFDINRFAPPPIPVELLPKAPPASARYRRQDAVDVAATAPIEVAAEPAPVAPEPVVPAVAAITAAPEPARPAYRFTGTHYPVDRQHLRDQGLIVPEGNVTGLLEEFRIVKRQLLGFAQELSASGMGAAAQRVLICSPHPGEGKTYTAVNLALSIAAEKETEVLLIDADFAKPSILSALGLPGGKGLMDALADPALDVAECVVGTDVPGLWVLPAGNATTSDSEYLSTSRTAAVLDRLTQGAPNRFVIFDSPPVLAASPAAELAKYVGQAVIVARADKTGQGSLEDAISLLTGCPHLQLLLNAVHFSPSGRRFGSYYGYGG